MGIVVIISIHYEQKKLANRSMFSQRMALKHATEIHMQFGSGSFALAHLFIVLLFVFFARVF